MAFDSHPLLYHKIFDCLKIFEEKTPPEKLNIFVVLY